MFYKIGKLRQSGFTLIEIIVTIVVLSVAATAIMSMFTNTIRTSADPMIQQQALSIAEAYMEEIMSKPFNDPGGGDGETARSSFDDVDDYNSLNDVGAEDENGNPIPILSAYTVTVTVTPNANLNGITDALRIRVSVDHTGLDPIVIHGFRTNYL
jgi:MSHA pilin protein MshD